MSQSLHCRQSNAVSLTIADRARDPILVLIFNEALFLGAFLNAVTNPSRSNVGFVRLKIAIQLHRCIGI